MKFLTAIYTLIMVLPELLRVLEAIEKKANTQAKKELVKKDFKKIADAFENGDAEMLKAIFMNKEEVKDVSNS